jgi:Integrase core domain
MEPGLVPLRIDPSTQSLGVGGHGCVHPRVIGFGVEGAFVDDMSMCRMFNYAVAGQPLPKRLSTDHDPLFRFHRWRANLRVLEIEAVKSVPYAPVSHPFVERLIGTIRREFLDRTFFWNSVDLTRKLEEFKDYYNAQRVHRALAGARQRNAPERTPSLLLPLITTLGGSNVVAYFRLRSPPDMNSPRTSSAWRTQQQRPLRAPR